MQRGVQRVAGALLLVALAALPSAAPSDPQEGLVVRVQQGALRGHRIQRPPGSALSALYAFEGVPFARPPVGARRFKEPEEPESWTGVRNVTSPGSLCPQISTDTGEFVGEENCLFLNIYTADPPALWATVRRPVIVFIHGGSFIFGTGNVVLARPDPILRQEVIYVAMNYRLGALGFLNTLDAQAPGNAGLKDQSMALRWVQRNIAAFGGDPHKITIMGESSGAACIHYHMLSPLSRGLFQRAVSVSGSVLSRWALVEEPLQVALALRRRFDSACPGEAADAVVACLQRVNASDLVVGQNDIQLNGWQPFFGWNYQAPSVEAAGASGTPFLSAAPEQLLRQGRFERVPYITGHTTGEGILYLIFGQLLEEPSRWATVDDNFEEVFRRVLPLGVNTPNATNEVRRFYFGERSLRNASENPDTLRRFVQLCTDFDIAVGSVISAEIMAEHGAPVYAYLFSREGPIPYWKIVLNVTSVPGVMHGDDMVYVFDYMNQTTGEPIAVPSSEQPLRDRQVKIFTNFAKTGNPTPTGSGLVRWPRFQSPRKRFLDMGERLAARDHALGERLAFWRGLAVPAHGTRGRKA